MWIGQHCACMKFQSTHTHTHIYTRVHMRAHRCVHTHARTHSHTHFYGNATLMYASCTHSCHHSLILVQQNLHVFHNIKEYECVSLCMYACMSTYMCVLCVCVCMCVWGGCVCTCMHACVYVSVCVHVCMSGHIFTKPCSSKSTIRSMHVVRWNVSMISQHTNSTVHQETEMTVTSKIEPRNVSVTSQSSDGLRAESTQSLVQAIHLPTRASQVILVRHWSSNFHVDFLQKDGTN